MASKCGWKECEMEIVFVSYRVRVKEIKRIKLKFSVHVLRKFFLLRFTSENEKLCC